MEPKDIAAKGYDLVAERHLSWIAEIRGDPRLRFLGQLLARLPDRPRLLDLGCGAGVPCTAAHVPRADHGELFRRFAGWLRPGGHFLAALGCGDSDDVVADWLGVPMFFSSHDARANRRPLTLAGLTVHVDECVTMAEPEGAATFQWVIATRTG